MISVGPLDLTETVHQMYRLADQYAGDVAPLHWTSLAQAYAAIQAIPYVPDGGPECLNAIECVRRPSLTLIMGGDCDDKAIVARAALNLLGYPSRFVTVDLTGSGEMEHVYPEVFHAGVWKPFDATTPELAMFDEKPFFQKLIW